MGAVPQQAALYCRLSYAPDGSLEKVERQEADGRKVASRLGWTITEVYTDNARSAWQRNRKRPRWDAMLEAIHDHDGIIVYHGDRLIRQPYDLEILLRLSDERQMPLASVSGVRNLSNPDDRFILRIEAAQACRESDNTSRRVKRRLDQRAEDGLPRGGGIRPFGFERDNVTINKAEAAIIREAAARILAGQSIRGLVKWINEDKGARTSRGNRWSHTTIAEMLARPRVAGLLERGGVLREAAWRPIIDVETWHDVKTALKTRQAPHAGRSTRRRYLLSGVAVCGTCGHPLITHAGKKRGDGHHRSYVCKNADCARGVSRSVEYVDRYVEGRAVRVLNDPEFIAALYSEHEDPGLVTQLAALERRKAAATAQLENLADFPEVEVESLVKGIASYDRKLRELRERRATTSRQRRLLRMAGVTKEQWDAEPVDVRRSTIADLFRIRVLPLAGGQGPGFDPRGVDVSLLTSGGQA